TDTAGLGAEEPAPSFALTLKLKTVCAVSPNTLKLVVVVVPMEMPSFRTVYPVILQLAGGVTAGQLKLVLLKVVPEAVGLAGAREGWAMWCTHCILPRVSMAAHCRPGRCELQDRHPGSRKHSDN